MKQALGRYRLLHRLGEGGMGEVYAAVVQDGDAQGSRVCIKVMKPALSSNPRAVDLFLREARHASRLRHPHIVRILEFGKDGDTWFLAMELLEGMAWNDVAQRAWRHGVELPLEVIVAGAIDAAAALHYAHTFKDKDGRPAGIAHRDISPDNLFLTRQGTTCILDFGIAKATAADTTSLTERGELRGKLPYMPPEQVRSSAVAGAADLWALGITLFYLSTAQRPFDRPTALDIIRAIEWEPAQSVLTMNPTLPPSFAAVVDRCLQKEPSARWPSAQALREALLALLPYPPDVREARNLLLRAGELSPGERRPMTAYASRAFVAPWPVLPAPSPFTATEQATPLPLGQATATDSERPDDGDTSRTPLPSERSTRAERVPSVARTLGSVRPGDKHERARALFVDHGGDGDFGIPQGDGVVSDDDDFAGATIVDRPKHFAVHTVETDHDEKTVQIPEGNQELLTLRSVSRNAWPEASSALAPTVPLLGPKPRRELPAWVYGAAAFLITSVIAAAVLTLLLEGR